MKERKKKTKQNKINTMDNRNVCDMHAVYFIIQFICQHSVLHFITYYYYNYWDQPV